MLVVILGRQKYPNVAFIIPIFVGAMLMGLISDKMIDQAFSDLKQTCYGVRDDYFGLCYLETEFEVPRAKAVNQIAFGGNDYGLDGFQFDLNRRNLYLFQFKNTTSAGQFKGSLERLIDKGMERMFVSPNKDDSKNQVLLRLWNGLIENRHAIDQVFFRFVFKGNAEEAERSQVLDKLREDLEDKKYHIDKFFGDRQVTLIVEFRSTVGGIAPVTDTKTTHIFNVPVTDLISRHGPTHERMLVGFVRLVDLHAMHQQMGQRFFKRNIRFGLGGNQSVNRVLSRAFKSIVFEGKESPADFSYNHNGITLFAEMLEHDDGFLKLTEPRLLNGAQTVTTLGEFLKANADNPKLEERRALLDELHVLCRIITEANEDFVTTVTINNNRQNPVEPWNLRANEMIHLQLQDRFNEELGIYYERQENAFENLSFEEREDVGITDSKPIALLRLTQTFLVSDGQIDRLSRIREVFEDDRVFKQVFHDGRLKADLRHVVLCYKIQFRLRKLLSEIADKGPNKYWYINRARYLLWALLCQALLNDERIDEWAELYGRRMSIEADFTGELAKLTTTRCRPLISALVADPAYVEKVAAQNLGFLRSNTAYKRCMDTAYIKWKWVEKKLN
jgi:hypothetical protein